MANIRIIDNWYVKVEPMSVGFLRMHASVDSLRGMCEVLIPQIKRHTDAGEVSLEYEDHYECGFCGAKLVSQKDWGCCDESVEEQDELEVS